MTDTILSATAGKAGKLVIHKRHILECGKHKIIMQQQKWSLPDTDMLTSSSAYFYIQDRSLMTNMKANLSISP